MKFLSLLLAGCTLFPVFAQEVSTASTEEFTNNRPEAHWHKMLGQDATGYYVLRKSGSMTDEHLWLEKYSPALKFISSSDIVGTSGVMGASLLHRFTEFNNGKVLIFLEGWNKAEGKNSLIVKEIDENGKPDEKGLVLETEFSQSQFKSADYSVSFSPDGSKLLVMTEKPFVKGEREEVRLQVFSTLDYSSIWLQEMTLENESERYPTNSIKVNNDGIAYLYKDIKISNKEHMYQLITSGKEFTRVKTLDLGGYFPTDYRMLIDPSGKLVIGGALATAGESADNWRATWYLQSNPEGDVLTNNVEQLGATILRYGLSEKASQVPNASLDYFTLRDVLLKPAGGIILLTEYERKTANAIGTVTPPVYQTEYIFGNVIALSLDGAGNRLWSNVLEKRQSELTLVPEKHYGSFTYQLKDDNLYMVWNYTDLHMDVPIHTWRYWFDRTGNKINIDNLYGKEALYPSLLTVINADGTFRYADRTFNSLPLTEIQRPNAFPMAIDPAYFFPTAEGIVVLARIAGPDTKRFKFNTIKY